MSGTCTSQAIFRPGSIPAAQCHASTVVQATDGTLVAAWFGGSYEGASDVAVWLARNADGTWGTPRQVAAVRGVPLWNPVLFRDRLGRLRLFYKVGPTVAAWTGAYLCSADSGLTWSAPSYLAAGLTGPAKNKPILLSNGDILCGASAETWRSWACWVEISADDGQSWQRHGPIALSGTPDAAPQAVSAVWNPETGALDLPDDHVGVIQPAVWEYAPGRLKMLMRATRRVGRICEATSDDYGRTWSAARRTELPNPNSGVDAVRLADGRIALVYNPTVEGRTPLALALSEDNGISWPHRRFLETGPGEYSYPAVIEATDGRIHVTYTYGRHTIQHVALDPAWIEAGKG